VGSTHRSVVVGRDTRTSGDVMKHALLSGLLSAGARANDVGIVPTPTLAWAARQYDAGVMITASHNPPEYNGLKLWNPDGSSFDDAQQQRVEEMALDDTRQTASWDRMEPDACRQEAVRPHIERIKQDFTDRLGARVVVDAGCGAASLVTALLLRELGCEVVALDCYPSGFFPRGIEPTEANLANLSKAVSAFGADIGIAHDGDADRMMAVDDRGRFIPGDKLLVVLARELGAKEVVTTVDASLMIEETGFVVRYTRVGDTYVSAELKEKGGDFGGEASGSWVFPSVSYCPDGIYAAAKIAAIASAHRISELVDSIPSYPVLRGSAGSDGVDAAVLEKKLLELAARSVAKTDGLKLDFGDGWLLVRASGTEPRIRLTAEAKTEARAGELYELGARAIRESMTTGGEKH